MPIFTPSLAPWPSRALGLLRNATGLLYNT